MKILFLTHRLPYAPNRGDRIRALYLLREMARFAEVSLFSLVHDAAEEAEASRMPFARDVVVARVPQLRNYISGFVRLATSRPLTHSLLDAPDARAKLTALAARANPDVVVALCSSMVRFALEPPLEGRPLILDMIDVDSVKWADLARTAAWPMSWVYRREARTLGAFEAFAAMRAHATLVVNERERNALHRLAPAARVEAMEVGAERERYAPPGPPAEAPVVIFCGMMSYVPNQAGIRWFAQDVWPLVRARHPDATFIVVGADAPASMRALSRVDPSIEITGRVPEVQPYLWKAAVSVAPLHVARGVQTKVLEALACGLPVVVTPAVLQGLPEAVHPGCVERSDAVGFASAVSDLLDRTGEERRAMAASADLSQLSWSKRLAGLEALLREAACRGTRGKAPAEAGMVP